jgi:PAS domain S-box-containing protein
MVFSVDADQMRTSFINDRWSRYTGMPFDFGPSGGWLEAVHPGDAAEARQAWERAIAASAELETAFRLRRTDGAYRWHLMRATPTRTRDGRIDCWVGTCTDIEGQKVIEEKLAQAIRSREELLAVVSHDLRNPLGVIMMGASLLEKRSPQGGFGALARSLGTRIRSAGERMNRLIEDLLSLAKLEAGHFAVGKPESFGVDLVREALDTMAGEAAEKDLRLELRVVDAGFRILCDHDQMLRVFWNLLGNAIKFTPKGGSVEVSVEPGEPGQVRFSVEDTGPGIGLDHLPHVFDRYWQARKMPQKGVGLGLTIARGIVEAHGGRIWAENRPQGGAAFRFTLAREAVSEARARRNEAAPGPPPS